MTFQIKLSCLIESNIPKQPKYTDDELKAIKDYKSGDAYVLNQFLRGRKIYSESSAERLHSDLKSALKKTPKHSGFVVYRGIWTGKDHGMRHYHNNITYKEGKIYKNKGYISTTKDKSNFVKIPKRDWRVEPWNVHMHLTVPANHPHINTLGMNPWVEQKEIILPHGTRFHVDKVHQKGKVTHVHATVLPVKTK